MGWHPIRMLGGALIWVFYIIVSFSEKIFALAIILKMTNPFALFSTAMDYEWFSGGDLGVLSGLANFVSSTYKIFKFCCYYDSCNCINVNFHVDIYRWWSS